MVAAPAIRYDLDDQDRIVALGGPWDSFALENDGPQVQSDLIRGRPIWSFVTGELTRMWLQTVFQLVRSQKQPITRPYRCDSPHLRRFMQMRIQSGPAGKLSIYHDILRIEQRSQPVYIHYELDEQEISFRARCSFCNRVKQGQHWMEPDAANAHPERTITVTSSVCPDCQGDLQQIGAGL
ncbi:MAG: hypothetical protein KDK39_13580 [Leptospiraceae bacterium]|nr:hypothetical protein [Leptospiraceae bacterium]